MSDITIIVVVVGSSGGGEGGPNLGVGPNMMGVAVGVGGGEGGPNIMRVGVAVGEGESSDATASTGTTKLLSPLHLCEQTVSKLP